MLLALCYPVVVCTRSHEHCRWNWQRWRKSGNSRDEWSSRRCASVGLCNAIEITEEETISQIAIRSLVSHLENSTSQALALAQALEQKLCNIPEAASNHLGCRWQFYVRKVRNRAGERRKLRICLTHIVLVGVVLVVGCEVLRTRASREGGNHSGRLSVSQVWKTG